MNIFISYQSEDRERALRFRQAIATATSRTVWWDQDLQCGGEWTQDLEKALLGARCVVVLWTPRSVASAWVVQEAAIARATGKLIPVLLETCTIPDAFRQIQTADLRDWSGNDKATEFQRLASDVEKSFAQKDSARRSPLFSRSVVTAILASLLSAGLTFGLVHKVDPTFPPEPCRDAFARLTTVLETDMGHEALTNASKSVLATCDRAPSR